MQFCNALTSDPDEPYCQIQAGADTEHFGSGPCSLHESRALSEIKSGDIVAHDAAYNALQPLLNRSESMADQLEGYIAQITSNSNFLEKQSSIFVRLVAEYTNMLRTLEKTVVDSENLLIKRENMRKIEQDWAVAYAAIDFIAQKDQALADQVVRELRKRFGSVGGD